MAERIKKHWDITLVLGIGVTLMAWGIIGMIGTIVFPNPISAATDSVTVSATVAAWASIDVTPSSITLSPNLVNSAGVTRVASSTSNLTLYVGTNSTSGWTVAIRSDGNGSTGGLYNSSLSGDNLIETVNTTSTLTDADDNDGYGSNATTSVAAVTITNTYNTWGTLVVGRLAYTNTQLASRATAAASTTVASVKVYAECDSAQQAATYEDILYISTEPNVP